MEAETIAALALLLTAVTSLIGVIGTMITARRVSKVQHEVTTLNGLTAANLLDAAETRRIERVAERDRTPGDREHLAEVPDPDAPTDPDDDE